jgi:RHS repeat-associated protein
MGTACNTGADIRITYPGTGNNSQFVYDGLGRHAMIQEFSGGSLTSTKQFIWSNDKRCEARNNAGTLTAQYFTLGQTISGTSYFYTADHLANPPNMASQFLGAAGTGTIFSPIFTSSIREMTDSSGVIQAQLSYDLHGRATQLKGSLLPDFQFGDYYLHAASGLGLTLTRAYSSSQGRFINRDRIGEAGGLNLYAYMSNHPEIGVDPSGTCALAVPIAVGLEGGAIGGGELTGLQGLLGVGVWLTGIITIGGGRGSSTGTGDGGGGGSGPCKPPCHRPDWNKRDCFDWCFGIGNCKPGQLISGCLTLCEEYYPPKPPWWWPFNWPRPPAKN